MFLPCNFELEINGINCSKVSRIEALTVRQTAISDDAGDARDHQKEPGKLEFPNLKITVPEARPSRSLTGWKISSSRAITVKLRRKVAF